MIGLDTNILVRYIVQDDPHQSSAATQLIESSCSPETPGFISLIVLCEIVWVLDRGYRYRRAEIADILGKILAAEDLQIENADLAWSALNYYQEGKANCSDYLIGLCCKKAGADTTFTFDQEASNCGLFKILTA